jgi:hypothetical protein
MKNLFILLFITLTVSSLRAIDKQITAEVVFENMTTKDFNGGEFYILETNEIIKINSLSSFKITLPASGKYQFSFATKGFIAYTMYPEVIKDKKNTITIRLVENKDKMEPTSGFLQSVSDKNTLTDEQFEQKIGSGQLYFIIHSLDSSIPTEYLDFEKKYGISLIKENCVIDPISSKKEREKNQIIADYLDRKYGDIWRKDLPAKPFGVKNF